MRVAFNPAARRELVETARWYNNEAGGLRADDFRKEVQRSLKLIVEHPVLGAIATSHTHSLPVHRYPYSLIYRIEGGTLRVLAVSTIAAVRGIGWGGGSNSVSYKVPPIFVALSSSSHHVM